MATAKKKENSEIKKDGKNEAIEADNLSDKKWTIKFFIKITHCHCEVLYLYVDCHAVSSFLLDLVYNL